MSESTTIQDDGKDWQRWLSPALLVLLLLYFGLVYHGTISMTEGVNAERDGFYHARYAQLLPERGLSREFRWMQFTHWRDHFCDKDTLYHLYLAPFCRDAAEPLPGAKLATVLLLLAALAALYVVLRKWNVPFTLAFVALLAVGSAHFIDRMLMVRSHGLSVVLTILAAHVILKRRFWPCVLMAGIYAWSYSVPLVMLIAALAIEFGRFMLDRDWKSAARIPLATALGLLAGLTLHPYSPNSLASVWMILKIAWSGATHSDVELGSEFQHLTFDNAFSVSLGTTLATLFAVAGALALASGVLKNRKLSPESAGLACAALAWFTAMFVFFMRFIEYAAPLGCLAGGFVARDLLGPLPPFWKLKASTRLAACGALAVILTGLHAFTASVVEGVAFTQMPKFRKPGGSQEENYRLWKRGRYFDGVAAWMKQNLPPRTLVANFYWDEFPELFYAAPEMNYLVGLDPTIMRLAYPEKSRALENMRTKKEPLSLDKIGALFDAEYVLFVKSRAAQFDALKTDAARARILFSDDLAVLYSTHDIAPDVHVSRKKL